MSQNDVEIVRIPADATLFRDQYFSKRRPVVVQGMFGDAPISKLSTLRDVEASLGDVQVGLRSNYMSGILSLLDAFVRGAIKKDDLYDAVVEEETVTIREYLGRLEGRARNGSHDAHMKYANEQGPAPELMQLLGRPPFFTELGVPGLVSGTDDLDEDAKLPEAAGRTFLFMANAGNSGDGHTDWDGRHVLNHEIAGRKRFVLFPPEAALKLSSVEIFLMPRLRQMPDEERTALLRYAGGCECILEPGEAIYMPPFWFHHIDYLTDAIGVAVRFAQPNVRIRKLINTTHRDLYLQNVWARILEEPDRPEHLDALSRIERARAGRHANRLAMYTAIFDLARDLCREWKVFPGEGSHAPWVSQLDLLKRPLSTAYLAPSDSWSTTKQRWWTIRETSRLAAATLMTRLVSTIEGPT